MSNESITSFSQLGLSAPVLKAVEEIGYETPSPIQAQSIPPLLEGRDIIGQAQTGTGKTAAFTLPLLSRLDPELNRPQILVLAPTRELAIQVAESMQTYARHFDNFHVLPIYGGQSMHTQLRQLRRGVQVVVGTPGRIIDHIKRKTLNLDTITKVVLDEADEMLRMGFIDDVDEILSHTPEHKQVALFSATMPEQIRKVARRHLNNPLEIKVKDKTSTVTTITQRYWQVSGMHKLDALTRMLEVEDFDAMIIFCRTRTATTELAEKLEARGHSSAPLNGDMNQAVREKTIERLKNGGLDIVVATDVAARGLDVERISHVINYDIPYDTEAYVHRIGRTGRAGRTGDAILFVAPREKKLLRMIERATNQPITPMQLPSSQDVKNRRVTQFKDKITATLGEGQLSFYEDIINGYQQENDIGFSEIAAALALLLNKERPLDQAFKDVPMRKFDQGNDRNDRDDRGDRGRNRFDRNERFERAPRDRNDRNDRAPRDRNERSSATEAGMKRYRIEVGRDHGVQPKHIVGAIANEANIDSREIGHIKLFDNFSTVDLPEELPREKYQALESIYVLGNKMNISADDGGFKSDSSKKSYGDKPFASKSGKKSYPPRHGGGKKFSKR